MTMTEVEAGVEMASKRKLLIISSNESFNECVRVSSVFRALMATIQTMLKRPFGVQYLFHEIESLLCMS